MMDDQHKSNRAFIGENLDEINPKNDILIGKNRIKEFDNNKEEYFTESFKENLKPNSNKYSKNNLADNENEDVINLKENNSNINKIAIQISKKDKKSSNDEIYTINSGHPLSKKEITQIVIEKSSNYNDISEIKVKYLNSNEGDIIIKFSNDKKDSSDNIRNDININQKQEENGGNPKNSNKVKFDKSSNLILNSKKKSEKEFSKKLSLNSSINNTNENNIISIDVSKRESKKKMVKKKHLEKREENGQNSARDLISNQRTDIYGNAIKKGGNHLINFAENLVDIVKIESYKSLMNKMTFTSESSTPSPNKCNCLKRCTIF